MSQPEVPPQQQAFVEQVHRRTERERQIAFEGKMRGEIHVRLPPGLALRVGTEVVDVQAGGESQSQTVFVAVGKFGERQQGKPPPFGRIDLKEAAHRLDERGKTARGGRIHRFGRSEGQILALHFEAQRGEVRRAGPFDGGKGAGIVRGAHG